MEYNRKIISKKGTEEVSFKSDLSLPIKIMIGLPAAVVLTKYWPGLMPFLQSFFH